ncbi:MAG: hypothetical protein KC496_21135, partial [Anaerolineae bacterium]|nr:hypothetical protein [Anaerolineae bacterium]
NRGQLTHAVDEWLQAKEEASYLLSGARLAQMETWANTTALTFTPDEKRFLQTSIDAREKHQSEEKSRQQREAQLEQRARKFLQFLAVGSVAAALIAIGLSIFAFDQQRTAQRERDTAQRRADENQSLVWAFQAQTLRDVNTPLALRLALESIRIDNPSSVALGIAHDIAHDDSVRYLLRAHIQGIHSIATNKDGTIAVTGSCGVIEDAVCLRGELAAWNLSTGNELWRIASHQGWVNAIVMTPHQTSIIAGGCGLQDAGQCIRGNLIEYDLATGDVIETISIDDESITALQYHLTEPELWIGTCAGTVQAWRSADETFSFVNNAHVGHVTAITFNPTGTRALSGDDTGHIVYWNAEDSTPDQSIEAHNNAITGLILIDDHVAITGSFDYTVKRWNLETGELLETLTNGDSTAGLLLSPTRDSVYILRSLIIRESPISDLSDEQDRFSREWYPADVQPENVSEIGTITTAALAQDAPVML